MLNIPRSVPLFAIASIFMLLCEVGNLHAAATGVPVKLLADLRAAPESIRLGDSVLRLDANVWRNFMPGSVTKAGANPMIAILVVTTDSGPPVALHADAIWMLQGERVWQSHKIEEGSTGSLGATNEYVVRDGPKLKPGTFIDIVARLSNLNGKYYYLAARHQTINAAT